MRTQGRQPRVTPAPFIDIPMPLEYSSPMVKESRLTQMGATDVMSMLAGALAQWAVSQDRKIGFQRNSECPASFRGFDVLRQQGGLGADR